MKIENDTSYKLIDIANIKPPKFNLSNIPKVKVGKKIRTMRANMTEVLNGHYVPTKLYMDIKSHMHIQIHKVKTRQLYTLSEMCGEEFWINLKSNWLKNQAGRAFAHMASIGIFPFKFVQYKKYSTKYYQLK